MNSLTVSLQTKQCTPVQLELLWGASKDWITQQAAQKTEFVMLSFSISKVPGDDWSVPGIAGWQASLRCERCDRDLVPCSQAYRRNLLSKLISLCPGPLFAQACAWPWLCRFLQPPSHSNMAALFSGNAIALLCHQLDKCAFAHIKVGCPHSYCCNRTGHCFQQHLLNRVCRYKIQTMVMKSTSYHKQPCVAS